MSGRVGGLADSDGGEEVVGAGLLELSGRVLNKERLDDTLLGVERKALRANAAEQGRGVEDKAEGRAEAAVRVGDEPNLGSLGRKLLLEGLLDEGVVDRDGVDVGNALEACESGRSAQAHEPTQRAWRTHLSGKSVVVRDVRRDLVGAGRGEGTGVAAMESTGSAPYFAGV